MHRLLAAHPWLPLLLATLLVACVASPAQPPVAVPPPTGTAAPVVPECRAASDCEVKNVGNCCGYYPACVGKDTPVDPAAVQAACQAKGMAGVCGFREIASCQCVAGKCEADDAGQPSSSPLIPVQP